MAYIGNIPAVQYASFSKQTLTPDSSTTSFTLDNAVANENELEVFVNNVRQEPGSGKAYTASGTTLTMSAAPTTGDSFYVIFQGKATQTVTAPAGSVTTSQLADLSVTSGKLASGVLPTNTPAFLAHATSGQTLSDSTATTVICETEIYDTDSAYDTTTGKFTCPAGQSGKYIFTLFTFIEHNGSNDYRQIYSEFQKNDASIAYGSSHQLYDENFSSPMRGRSLSYTLAINLIAGDTVKGRVYQDNSADASRGLEQASFSGFRLIGV